MDYRLTLNPISLLVFYYEVPVYVIEIINIILNFLLLVYFILLNLLDIIIDNIYFY